MSRLQTIAAEIGALVAEKDKAYGSAFAKCGDFLRLLYPNGIQPEQYTDALCMVRMFDKQMRIATHKTALGESPYRDLAGYGILGAAKDETPPLPDPWDKCKCGNVVAECCCPDPIAHLDRNVKVENPSLCGRCAWKNTCSFITDPPPISCSGFTPNGS